MSSIEQLRRDIEAQEKQVAALREQKAHRDALLAQIRSLISCTEPELFASLNHDVSELMYAITAGRTHETASPSSKGLSSSYGQEGEDEAAAGVPTALFSEEMEERIMQEEEPPLPSPPRRVRGKRKKRDRNKERNKKKQQQHKHHVDPCGAVLSKRETAARSALLAAVDALQLEHTPNTVDEPPLWLSDVETPPPPRQEEQQGADEKEEGVDYSDDFEELSDAEREGDMK
ncbi:hypothetical protein DQ04_03061040 [Trypanosoma grayi]|uniref:hypothetical protein n=1 Tax=Trypanosoma grayi TaxID=71804 RepID=UPI0004F40ADB|nr:hypothetical protein DQ04_03061040 [Trypanosoma grayi]KEG11009.1 hypothetical protein DQ04_03061040 [Trypanosoma grayi]